MNATTARAVFLENRRRFIGGTDISAIVGLSPWASPLSVYYDKVGESIDQTETLAMRRGRALERFIAREFIRRYPQYVVDMHPPQIIRTDWGFPAGASEDGEVRKRRQHEVVGVLECKSTSAFNARQFDETAQDLPDQYFIQGQWYMGVRDLPCCFLAVDVGDPRDIRIIKIERDEKVVERLVKSGRSFWKNHVERHSPPSPDGSERDAGIVRSLFPTASEGTAVELDGEAHELLSDYLAHSFKIREHQTAADAAKQQLQLLMGDAESAIVGNWRLSYKNVTQTRLDGKALKAAEPDTWQRYAKKSESRRFDTPKEMTT